MSVNDSSASGYLKREQLVGKSVVSSTAEIIGTVADIAVGMNGKVGLHVSRKSGPGSEEVIINADEIQAMGDVVLLKPVSSAGKTATQAQPLMPPPFPSAGPQSRACGRCGYINGANSRFCIKCGMSLQ